MVFVKDITDTDIDSPELKLTFGGRKVLKRLKKVCSDKHKVNTFSLKMYLCTFLYSQELSSNIDGNQDRPLGKYMLHIIPYF